MASSATVLQERREGVVLLRLNRPQKHNAFNGEMSRTLTALLDELEADGRVHVAVLTGSGRAFSAGADMTESLGALEGGGCGDGMARAIRRVADFSKPIIAAVNGHALGGGALLAVVCDIRLASPQASFRFPGAVYGLVVGGSQLPRIVGAARAKELIFTARTVDAEEAERIGLVNRVVPAEELEGAAWEMAACIAGNSPEAVRWSKVVIDAATEVGEAVRLEMGANLELWGSPDHRERFRAATERLAGPNPIPDAPRRESPMVSDEIRERVASYLAHQATKEPADLRSIIERERARLLGVLEGLSEVQASWKPQPDEWSIREVLRHVLAAEKGVIQVVMSLAAGVTPQGEREIGRQDPDESATLGDLIERLRRERQRLLAFLDSLPPSTDLSVTFPHPFFGPLNWKGWVAFQRVHDGDHIGQIEAIKATNGFPSS